ncbi:MAG: hypothetical protein ACSHYC_09755 [Alphaproteobacteria bacterium]
MYPRLTYFLGGAVAAVGVVVTLTDPKILENVATFPERVVALFQDEKAQLFDTAAVKIIVEGRLRTMFENSLDISDHSKDKLAAHFADECLEIVNEYSFTDNVFESPNAIAYPRKNDPGRNEFGTIAGNITGSISDLPGMMTGCFYRVGITLGIVGGLRKRDYVLDPSQTPLKDGAIRLSANGGLFVLPIVSEAMLNSIGTSNGLLIE